MDAPQWVRDQQFEYMLGLWRADHDGADPDNATSEEIRQHAHSIADDIHRSQYYER